MPKLVMVPDPLHVGSTPPHPIPRSWAMRALFEHGASIGDIARKYDVPYQRAYNAIHATSAAESAAPAPKSSAALNSNSDLKPSAGLPRPPKRRSKVRPGRPINTRHSRAEMKTWSTQRLKQAITVRGLQPGTRYAIDLQDELETRDPNWVDNL